MSNQPFRVVIAGGGVAALEALLCLAQAGLEHLELTLIAPEEAFSYRPASTAQPFVLHPEHSPGTWGRTLSTTQWPGWTMPASASSHGTAT